MQFDDLAAYEIYQRAAHHGRGSSVGGREGYDVDKVHVVQVRHKYLCKDELREARF